MLQIHVAARWPAIVDHWTALHRARAIGWLGIADDDDEHEPALDVETASHYALASKGGWCRAGASSSPRRRRSMPIRPGST